MFCPLDVVSNFPFFPKNALKNPSVIPLTINQEAKYYVSESSTQQLNICFTISIIISLLLLPGPGRRLAPVIKCNAFLCFQSYIVRDISLTEIYRWLVTFGSVRWDISLVQKFEVGSNNCNHVNINSISLHTEWFNATIFTTYQ